MLQGVTHQPYGYDDLYLTEPTQRIPTDPLQGDTVLLGLVTWPIEMGQTVWVTWTKNGVAQPDVGAQWQSSNNGQSLWQATLGQFQRGDVIEYSVHANENQTNEKVIGPFSFSVASWSTVTNVTGHIDNGTSVDVQLGDSAGSFSPVVRIAFPTVDSFHLQFSPTGGGLTISEPKLYTLSEQTNSLTLSTSALVVTIQKTPYRLSVYAADGKTLIAQEYDPANFRNLGWASDGKTTITRIEDHFQTPSAVRCYGFGERYDALNQNGRDVNTYIYNEYGDQGTTGRTYLSAPLFVTPDGYGIYVVSTAYAIFNLGSYRKDMAGFTVNATKKLASTLEYYFFSGTPKHILDRYSSISGRP
jgi:alpha-glucosidase (family GH31 glycosyl hydrolase)